MSGKNTASPVVGSSFLRTPPVPPVIPTHNSFELLSDLENSERENEVPLAQTPSSTKVRVPPIYIMGMQMSDIFQLLSAAGVSPSQDCPFVLKHTKASVQLLTKSKDVFNNVLSILKGSDVQYYTHDTSENVATKFVLSGLPLIEISDLKTELAANEICPRDIKLLTTTKSTVDQIALYLLYFPRGTMKIQELRKTRSLFNVAVSWRFFVKRPSDAAQCHRCQKFGHGSSNCNLPPKCVKCGSKHLTKVCQLPTKTKLGDANKNKSQIKCANCEGNHTANFRGCPARQNYLKELEKRKKKPNNLPPGLTDSTYPRLKGRGAAPTTPHQASQSRGGISFANVLLSDPRNVPLESDDEPTSDNLFSISEFLCLARDMFIRLSGCRTKQQQFLALSELMIKYVYHG